MFSFILSFHLWPTDSSLNSSRWTVDTVLLTLAVWKTEGYEQKYAFHGGPCGSFPLETQDWYVFPMAFLSAFFSSQPVDSSGENKHIPEALINHPTSAQNKLLCPVPNPFSNMFLPN